MTPVETLLSILDLERLEQNLFRGHAPLAGWKRVYGGLVIAQALGRACIIRPRCQGCPCLKIFRARPT